MSGSTLPDFRSAAADLRSTHRMLPFVAVRSDTSRHFPERFDTPDLVRKQKKKIPATAPSPSGVLTGKSAGVGGGRFLPSMAGIFFFAINECPQEPAAVFADPYEGTSLPTTDALLRRDGHLKVATVVFAGPAKGRLCPQQMSWLQDNRYRLDCHGKKVAKSIPPP